MRMGLRSHLPRIALTVVLIAMIFGAALPETAHGQAFSLSIVHQFGDGSDGPAADDGAHPSSPMILAGDGNFYGTTEVGGTTGPAFGGYVDGRGTAFRMTPAGTVTILHNFSDGSVINDGADPAGALIQGLDDNFYGTTFNGGANHLGTVFKMTSAGTITVLHSFGAGTDGAHPVCNLIQAADGTLYGTTREGGLTDDGTIFSITPSGTYAKLHDFSRNVDGTGPSAGLVDGTDGFYYGTTAGGRAPGDNSNDWGTIFKITPAGVFTHLHTMTFWEGYDLEAGLTVGLDGNLYGIASSFSAPTTNGTIFRATRTGVVTALHSFSDTAPDGKYPVSQLVTDSNGVLYGTFELGGLNGTGGIFRIDESGHYRTIVSYTHNSFGVVPNTYLTMTNAGELYGVSYGDDVNGYGSVFKLTNTGPGGPATQFVIIPDPLSIGVWQAGVPFMFDVTAEDASGNIASGYSGTVHFTSTDPLAALPSDSTLTNDQGTFTATLYGSNSISATDTVAPSITGSAQITVDPLHINFGVPPSVTAGTPFSFAVAAFDPTIGQIATQYPGTLQFFTNAPRSTLPGNSTLTNGFGSFSATFTDIGTSAANFKLTAVDTASPAIHGTSVAVPVNPAPATYLTVIVPPVVQGNIPANVTVQARDACNNTATGYSGTVRFTSSDGAAVLPANSTLTNGMGTFSVNLKTGGMQSVTATDTVSSGISGTSKSTLVLAAAHFRVTGPSSVTAGTPFSFTVQALDQYYQPAPGYTGTVAFFTDAPRSTIPGNSGISDGSGSFSATFTDLGTSSANFKVTAMDINATSIRGTSSAIAVTP